MPEIAEVKLSQGADLKLQTSEKIAIAELQSCSCRAHSFKSCGIAIAKVLPSSCGIAFADSEKKIVCTRLCVCIVGFGQEIWSGRSKNDDSVVRHH